MRKVLLGRTSYKRKGGMAGIGVNFKKRKMVNMLSRTVKCSHCSAMFQEELYRDKHERDFHDE